MFEFYNLSLESVLIYLFCYKNETHNKKTEAFSKKRCIELLYSVRQKFLLAHNIQHTIYNKEEKKKIFVF
jgi:hypothetical protein